jgi:hypothetical protein
MVQTAIARSPDVLGRVVLPMCAVLAAGACHAAQSYEFDVELDSRRIGTHRFIVTGDPAGSARIESSAAFDVKMLGVTVYRYRHQAETVWSEGCLVSIDATTQNNGRSLRVQGSQHAEGFRLRDPPPVALLPGCITSYAYWDRDRLLRQRVLLNPQTGKLDTVRFEPLGREPVPFNGASQMAERYRLHGPELVIDLWYSPQGEWLRLESTTESRRRIVYLRQDSPAG